MEDGTFEERTVNDRVDKRVRGLEEIMRKFARVEGDEEKTET